MFVFDSPCKPDLAKHPPSARKKARPFRRRRSLHHMDHTSHRACVAHYEEPTFCASDFLCLIPRFGAAASAYSKGEELANGAYVSDDDEDGGVSLNPAYHDDVDLAPSSPSSSRSTGTSESPSTSLICGRSHSRPVSRDIWEEEDGRRLRFALQEAEEDARVRARLSRSRSLGEQGVGQTSPATDDAQEVLEARLNEIVFKDMENAAGHGDNPDTQSPSHHDNAEPRGSIDSASNHTRVHPERNPHNYDFGMEDDALAVDDHRRNYDVADFMDAWRLHWLTNKRVPPCEAGLQPSIKIGRPREEITRKQVGSSAMDIQGLNWKLLGPKREDAMQARKTLHPSRQVPSTLPIVTANHFDDELLYRFRAFSPRHRARFSHYQLRNVLAAPSRSAIFYSVGDRVMQTSLACPTTRNTAMDLSRPSDYAVDFRITCLAATPQSSPNPLLFAGGFYGEYAMLPLNSTDQTTNVPEEGFVTHAYNGLVTHIHTPTPHTSTHPHAAICSNDHSLRILDPVTQTFILSTAYPTALNCAATSPDARLRVLVGDSAFPQIIDAVSGTPLVTLSGHHDHGFACAWANDGRHVATASQDGSVLVWDARHWARPLHHAGSEMSCARSLHFTDDGTLVVAEDDDMVSFYSLGNRESGKQHVRFFGAVAGVALLDGGKEVVVANADRSIGGLVSLERTTAGLAGPWGPDGGVESGLGMRSGRGRGRRLREGSVDVEELLGEGGVADLVL